MVEIYEDFFTILWGNLFDNVQLLHENGNLEIESNQLKDIGLVGPKTLDPITGIWKTDQFVK